MNKFKVGDVVRYCLPCKKYNDINGYMSIHPRPIKGFHKKYTKFCIIDVYDNHIMYYFHEDGLELVKKLTEEDML